MDINNTASLDMSLGMWSKGCARRAVLSGPVAWRTKQKNVIVPDPSQNPPPPPPPLPEPPRQRTRRRRSRSGSPLRGRIYLILFWLLLNAYHLLGYFGTAEYAKRDYARHEAPIFVITTSLFVAVICRQGWARYLLLFFLLFRLVSTLIFVPTQTEAMLQSFPAAVDVLFYPVLNACILWGIVSIPSIRRLVSRTYE